MKVCYFSKGGNNGDQQIELLQEERSAEDKGKMWHVTTGKVDKVVNTDNRCVLVLIYMCGLINGVSRWKRWRRKGRTL